MNLKERAKQLKIDIPAVFLVLKKYDSDTHCLDLANVADAIQCISGKSAHGFSNNKVDSCNVDTFS